MQCPNCGGPIEMKLGSSWAVICSWCRASVVRSDRDLRALGTVADLVPTAPEHAVGDTGTIAGDGIIVGGRIQLDHGRGPWDEWYVQHTQSGQWGWLAKAQGRWYLTHPTQPSSPLPPWEHMGPGQQGQLPGVPGVWSVDERGESTTLSAEGELPFPVMSGERGRYVDLSGPDGGFATIDYGDGSQPPTLYVGRRLGPGELQMQATGVGPRPSEAVAGQRLRCPTCGDAVPIHAPEITERAVCGSCNSLLDYSQGKLSFLKKIDQHRSRPAIPLGSEGTLLGEKLMCIGYMERWTRVLGERFTWREYLLHGEHGYRWLMEDQGHWVFLRPATGAEVHTLGRIAKVAGRRHVLWNAVHGHVSYVLGEFYWRVEKGESARLRDYIKPPYVVSQERTDREVSWSVGEHVEGDEVLRAFGVKRKPPPKIGVGLVQPNPHGIGFPAVVALMTTLALFLLMGMVKARHPSDLLVDGPIAMPMRPSIQSDRTGASATVTPPFEVRRGPTLLEVEVRTDADNQYVGIPAALIEQNTGEVIDFYVDAEYYHGTSGGESWTEGSWSSTAHVNEVPSGTYVLRVDPFWQSFPQPGAYSGGLIPPTVELSVSSGATSMGCVFLALFLLWLPAIIVFLRHGTFEKKRQELKTVH